MKVPYRWAAVLALPVLLQPASQDSIRGFDPASQAREISWERRARAVPDAARVRTLIEKLSDKPHLAGTPQSKETADYILSQLREYGLDAHIEQYEAALPTPKTRAVELVSPVTYSATLEEPAVPEDRNSSDAGMIPPYNAYSGDGDVTSPLVYVNQGVPADYAVLAEHGIDVRGKIVIARYGGSWRGTKPKVAQEHGAVGCLIYSDPRDDGYFQGDVFPKGPFRPAGGVQRGSVVDLVQYTGDPLSPGWSSEPGSKRLAVSEAATFMKIPVLPMSYEDALPLLRNLDGPVAPEAWRGALPTTYHIGGKGNTKVHLHVTMDNSTRPLYDVIATIPGTDFPDQWVLYGNHHDAWVHGASDPVSGLVPLMETARAFGELLRAGWKPRRTVMLTFWDGEEFGLMGSTEYMEKHADELSRKAVAYLNSDSNGRGALSIGGSHTLESFSEEVARDINDPVSGKSLLDAIAAQRKKKHEADMPEGGFHILPLGSGSDYTPFLQHLGVASMNLGFAGESEGGIYHSDYDDFYWFSHFGDPTFVYGRTLAQVNTTMILRLADAPLLPFTFGPFASTVSRYLDEIEKLPNQKKRVDLAAVRTRASRLAKSAVAFDAAYARALPGIASADSGKLANINQLLYGSERDLTLDPGLPGRPWYRHRIYAPGEYTGYAVKTLPGIREAVEAGRPEEAARQAKQVEQVLRTLTERVDRAAGALGGL